MPSAAAARHPRGGQPQALAAARRARAGPLAAGEDGIAHGLRRASGSSAFGRRSLSSSRSTIGAWRSMNSARRARLGSGHRLGRNSSRKPARPAQSRLVSGPSAHPQERRKKMGPSEGRSCHGQGSSGSENPAGAPPGAVRTTRADHGQAAPLGPGPQGPGLHVRRARPVEDRRAALASDPSTDAASATAQAQARAATPGRIPGSRFPCPTAGPKVHTRSPVRARDRGHAKPALTTRSGRADPRAGLIQRARRPGRAHAGAQEEHRPAATAPSKRRAPRTPADRARRLWRERAASGGNGKRPGQGRTAPADRSPSRETRGPASQPVAAHEDGLPHDPVPGRAAGVAVGGTATASASARRAGPEVKPSSRRALAASYHM